MSSVARGARRLLETRERRLERRGLNEAHDGLVVRGKPRFGAVAVAHRRDDAVALEDELDELATQHLAGLRVAPAAERRIALEAPLEHRVAGGVAEHAVGRGQGHGVGDAAVGANREDDDGRGVDLELGDGGLFIGDEPEIAGLRLGGAGEGGDECQ